MKDVFGRDLEVGDTIICFPYSEGKKINIETVTGFWGSDGFIIVGERKLKSECLILKRADGTQYFNNEGLPLNCWQTNFKDKKIF